MAKCLVQLFNEKIRQKKDSPKKVKIKKTKVRILRKKLISVSLRTFEVDIRI